MNIFKRLHCLGFHNWGVWGLYIKGPWNGSMSRTCKRCKWEDIRKYK